jgi:hypothetical protein
MTLPFIACPYFALSASFANVNKALFLSSFYNTAPA